MTQRSLHNNTNVSLKAFGVFTGGWETTTNYLEASVFVNSTAYLAIGIQQSQDASGVAINTTYNYTPTDEVTVFNTAIGLPFFRIVVTNEANVSVAHMSVVSVLTAIPSGATAPTAVIIDGVVDVSGNVVATNLITETLATRRVDFLVVGDWYRVASVGLTSGAEWQALSGGTACVGGQSVPDVGRLFQAVAVGPAVAGGGTCYDVEYTEAVSATITNFPSFPAVQPVSGTVSLADPTSVRIRDSYGDLITTTAGNLMVGINNIYTANPLHTILDSGTVGIDSGNNTVKLDPFNATVTINDGNLPLPVNIFNGTMAGYANIPVNIDPTNNLVSVNDSSTITVSSITNALPTGTNNIGLVSLDGTGVGNLVQLSQTGSQNGVQVVSPLPAGTNTIGKVILDTGTNSIGTVGIDTTLNTIKIDPTANEVKVNPTAQPPVRLTGLGNTALSVGGPGLLYGLSYQNKSPMINCWIKLYDLATTPTAADTPFLIQYLESVQQYNLSHSNSDCYNAPIQNTLWVRASLLPTDGDNTDTDIEAEITAFVGS